MRAFPAFAIALTLACSVPASVRPSSATNAAAGRTVVAACSPERVNAALLSVTPLAGRVVAADESLVLPESYLADVYAALANRVLTDSLLETRAARVAFTLARDGAMSDFAQLTRSGSPMFDRAVVRAVVSAGLTRSMPALPRDVDARRVSLVLEVRGGAVPDGWQRFPLRLALDTARVSRKARAAPGNTAPRYPTLLRQRGISGEVLLHFIVDSDGRPDTSSVLPLLFSDAGFLNAVLAHLPSMTYLPATLGDCAVPAWVTQPFTFYVGRRMPRPPRP